MKYSLSPREVPQAPPLGFPSCSGYFSPYIPPLVIIQIQYSTLYHGLATFTEVTFVNVHPAQMSTFVIEVYLWYIGFVLVFTTKINRKYRLWYNVSVPYPKPGLAENTGNVEIRAAPLVQHYALNHGLAIYTGVTFVNVTLVEAVPSGRGPAVV